LTVKRGIGWAGWTWWSMMLAINLPFLSLFLALIAPQSNPLIEGIAQFQRGEYVAAESSLEKVVLTQPDSRAYVFLSLSRAANGKCEAAIPELEKQFPIAADAEIRRLAGLGLAQCYLSTNRTEDALAVLVSLKKLYPSDADVLYETARVYMKAWNETLHEMFEKTPASFRVNQLSGEIFDTQGNYSEAVEQFREAIAKNPKALDLHFRAGRALLMSSHSPDILSAAQREFEAELALNPTDAVAEYEIGQILVTQQKSREALVHMQRAVELNGRFPEALIALAKLKVEAKQSDEAISLLERAVQIVPNSEAARYSLMMAYRDTGRTQDALREKAELEKLQKPPEGEFTEFLKKLGEKAPQP
jgi:tetratricopeptide (TPR) repeat protein